ncbi:LysM peptidoglycan-binding domain-containing protein [Anabaena cylindrica FACHB-243]|uniref:Peptidoglycan-binding lysin domain protein n=1 Tax=Anabaena cylindrica (strain ATCC 27899 / PCC 7122) TaxID=272123 RepID=K9ZBR6_ANACC|nr:MULTISPECIES: LysM peptidoglycan-binding domain-containing protein [Anabaena]AFZ55805.1 Peptidoglycan-binding lysin domain protein [Anabaena cylindrica PCC 7122]MBD2420191.1 LysM peptidoglycan-binding domain-containing protein [Anabaena cylindrica FACHB-243]MBY5283062.1 LysM peptidoglycan-binding domain-containing protein [Anabaena sp. CCAP 1446/1C]MBY5311575.1 LysM peptidoglycan-binding domain-containing protein [Anabaena sp. CCAP 1446/1C]MCM2406156.1 LysM peptidoglycan-binding domain-cont
MALEKLKIKAEKSNDGDFADEIEVLFNPNQVQINKTGWNISDKGLTAANDLASLTIELFFDTTLTGSPPENVQQYTKKIFNLTQPRIGTSSKRPPRCKLVWGTIGGKDSVLLPDGVLESVTKTLTQFLEDGTPVRATLNCTFREWTEPEKQQKEENLIDDPVRIVKRGETLSSIANEEYGDPALWRIIAEENRLDNPRKISPGLVLTIPPLRIPSQT